MTKRVTCWRCGVPRPIFESCLRCGGSCKPLTMRKQLRDDLNDGAENALRLKEYLGGD